MQQLKRLQAADDEVRRQLSIRAGHGCGGRLIVDVILDGRKLYMLQMPDVKIRIRFEASDLCTALALFYERCRERGTSAYKENHTYTNLQVYDKSNDNVIITSSLTLKDTLFAESEYRSLRVALRSIEAACVEPPAG